MSFVFFVFVARFINVGLVFEGFTMWHLGDVLQFTVLGTVGNCFSTIKRLRGTKRTYFVTCSGMYCYVGVVF